MSLLTRSHVLVASIGAALSLCVFAAPVGANDPKDCSDFKTHKQAQKWFKHHHPHRDPAGLDSDHDGVACEDLP
jgi:hypothetical protein